MKLIAGKRYRLPNGRVVTARDTTDGMMLEFDRKNIEPIVVDPLGILVHRGEAMRQTTELLSPVDDLDVAPLPMEFEELMRMIFELKELGGKPWMKLWECVRHIHAEAKGVDA